MAKTAAKRAKKGKGGEATVKEACDTTLLGRALDKTCPPEKTEEEKASYAARMSRLLEAMRRRQEAARKRRG